MLSALRRLLRRPDALTAASRRADRQAFVRLLAETDVTVLAALDGPGLEIATLTQEALLAQIERDAEAIAASEHWLPFVYERDDARRCLPFFSTSTHMEAFCRAYSMARGRVFGWEPIVIPGSSLRDLLPHCDALVLNAGTSDEQALTIQDAEILLEAGV